MSENYYMWGYQEPDQDLIDEVGELKEKIEDLELEISRLEDELSNAIPIELIEKEMKRLDEDIKWAWYYGNVSLDKMEYLKMWLTIKLEDWRKGNETN